MKWIKKGRIFVNTGNFKGYPMYSQCPTPLVCDEYIRIFISARTTEIESHIVYIDVDKECPSKILNISDKPIISKGELGSFDENGMIPSYVFNKGIETYLYYSGWSRCSNVPYKNFTGLAISTDLGSSFKKYACGPVLGMNQYDTMSATSPWIIQNDNEFIALYSTGTHWYMIDERLEHTYTLTYATSSDALNWNPSGKLILDVKDNYEAICKPTVIKVEDKYHMWFSTRGSHGFRNATKNAYRIGYAVSDDLIHWCRNDALSGIDVSEEGWDSEMICYPYIIQVNGKYLMFYNGNYFGKEGFGYAELDL